MDANGLEIIYNERIINRKWVVISILGPNEKRMDSKWNTLITNTRKNAIRLNLFLSSITSKTETKAKIKKSPPFAMSVQPGVNGINVLLISKKNPDINVITPTFRATRVTDLSESDPPMSEKFRSNPAIPFSINSNHKFYDQGSIPYHLW